MAKFLAAVCVCLASTNQGVDGWVNTLRDRHSRMRPLGLATASRPGMTGGERLLMPKAIPMLPSNENQEHPGNVMPAPLDPVVEKIIPLLPLRDPETMTPGSAREALRALAASRAPIPPPPVASAEDTKVKGAAGFLNARVYRMGPAKAPTV